MQIQKTPWLIELNLADLYIVLGLATKQVRKTNRFTYHQLIYSRLYKFPQSYKTRFVLAKSYINEMVYSILRKRAIFIPG